MLNSICMLVRFFILVLLILSAKSFAKTSSIDCAQDKTICSYYCKKSSEMGCPANGYLLSFAYKYCHQYLKREDQFSVDGQWVLANIRSCLIESLSERNDLTCSNVKHIALESHVTCYVENGFCDLNHNDRSWVYWIARRQAFKLEILQTMQKISKQCHQ